MTGARSLPWLGELAALLPDHQLGHQLGSGGSGIVVEAHHLTLDRADAVKVLAARWARDLDTRERFVTEGRLLARLDHRHIVRVYDCRLSGPICALVMERLTAGSLHSRFGPGGITQPQSCATVLAILAALEAAHRAGVLHRDIKPGNVLFGVDGTPKVVDFGIAEILGGQVTLATSDGRLVSGTPRYMAPEQILGAPPHAGMDVYAAGAVLYELLTGRPTHTADRVDVLLVRRITDPPSTPGPDVPPSLVSVVMTAIAREPADRYQTAEAFAVALAAAATEAFGAGWLERTGVRANLSEPVSRALAPAVGRWRPADPALALDTRTRIVLPVLMAAERPPAPAELDAIDLVPIQQVAAAGSNAGRPALLGALLLVGLLVLALLGLAAPGGRQLADPVSDLHVVGSSGTASDGATVVDLSDPLIVAGTGPPGGGTYRVRLLVSVAGLPLGTATSAPVQTTAGKPWQARLDLRSWTRWVAGGAIHDRIEFLRTGGSSSTTNAEGTFRPRQPPYLTVMGAGAVVLLLFGFGFAESVLGSMRRGERPIAGPILAGFAGVPIGIACWLIPPVFAHHEPWSLVGVGCVLLAAGAGVAFAVATRRRALRRWPSVARG